MGAHPYIIVSYFEWVYTGVFPKAEKEILTNRMKAYSIDVCARLQQ